MLGASTGMLQGNAGHLSTDKPARETILGQIECLDYSLNRFLKIIAQLQDVADIMGGIKPRPDEANVPQRVNPPPPSCLIAMIAEKNHTLTNIAEVCEELVGRISGSIRG